MVWEMTRKPAGYSAEEFSAGLLRPAKFFLC